MTGAGTRRGGDVVGAGLVALAAACFGTLGPLSRFAGDAGVESLSLVAWRAAIGATVVLLFIAVRAATGARRGVLGMLRAVPVRDRWFMGAAAVANALLNFAAFEAFERITIALTLLVFYLYPAGVAVASTLWFGERLDRARWAALVVSLVGMALVVLGAGDLGRIDGIGIGLAFVAGISQVFYVLAARHGFAHVPGPEAATLTMGGAAAIYVAVAAAGGVAGALAQPLASMDAATPVLLAGIVGAGVPTLAFILGIRRLGAPQAAIISTLEPVVGVGLAAWLLAEQPTGVQVGGGALILGAAVLLQLRARRPAEHEAVATDPEVVDEEPAAVGSPPGTAQSGRDM